MTDEMRAKVEKVMKNLERNKMKPYFCEINVMPGLEGIEKASGINVAGKIIETIQSDFTSKT